MIKYLVLYLICFYSIRASAQPIGPGKRVDPEMFFHHGLKKVVLMDGTPPFIHPPSSSEIWCWDGLDWKMLPSKYGPDSRYAGAAVYDVKRNVIVSFGGRIGKNENVSNDTWEWNSMEWKMISDTSTPARDHHMMAYDAARQKIILFGGGIFPRIKGPWNSDTWEWDGIRWKKISMEGPAGRVSTMVYDNKHKCIILFGGVGAPGPDGIQPNYNDTWSWNGTRWRKLSDEGPKGRSRHAMVFDQRHGKLILYGGERNNQEQLGDMWEWNGRIWTEINPGQPNPGERRVHAMAYDETRGVVVLFGGMHQNELMTDTWEWDGMRWHRVSE